MARRNGYGAGADPPSHTPSPAKKQPQGLGSSKWATPSNNNNNNKYPSPSPSTPITDSFGYEPDRQGGGGKRVNTGLASTSGSDSSSRKNMPKRGAEEYITKDHGTIKNNGAGEDKPTMSTAAQQARRKIAQPKSRLGRSTTPTSTGGFGQQAQSSPFSFPGAANTSSSFPPPQQQSFNFSAPGSSSFTFGASTNNAQPVSNPFASLNGGVNGATSTPSNDAMMETSPQANKTTNVFGASTSVPSTNGFSFNFGQPAPQSSQPSTGGFQFGQQKTQEQGSSTSLFGQTAASQPQTNGFSFGQTTTQSSAPTLFSQSTTTSAPSFSFGGTSTSTPSSTPAPAPTFKFGEASATPGSKPEETTAKTTPSFGFGQTSSFGKPASDAAPATEPAKPAWSFGRSAESLPETTPSKPAFSFGQPASTTSQAEPASAPPKQSGFMFGQTAGATSSAPASNSLFGSNSKPAEPSSASGSLFSRMSPADETPKPTEESKSVGEQNKAGDNQQSEDAGPKNPFASLFGSKSQSESTPSTSKPLFNFGSPSKPAETPTTSNNLFSPKAADPSSQIEKPKESSSSFNFSQSNQSSGGLFSPKADTSSERSNNLFNLNKPAEEASEDSCTTGGIPSTSMLASKPANLSSNAGSTPFKLGQRNEEQDKSAATKRTFDDSAAPEKKKLFTGSSTPSSMAKSAGVSFESRTSSGPSAPVQPKLPEKSTAPPEISNRAVSTEGPPQIPRFLSADKYKLYDENWRLKGLNRRFKEMVARCDPDTHDFLNLVQNYLDHREATGAIGLPGQNREKLNPVAGTKRKTIDVDDMQDAADQNKKSRHEPAPASTFGIMQHPKPASTPSNLFGSVASPKPPATFSPSKAASDPTTSNLFKSMIPGATSTPTTMSATPAFTPTTTSATSTFSFGGSSAPAKSTTPPSSPPKSAAPQLPKFEVPKFGGGANFSNAFAQAAAANSKKFEQEAKEKRKAEEFDSDEDDEEAWNKKYEEEQRAKKAKIEAAAKSLAVPGFVASASSSRSNSPFAFGGPPAKSIERSVSPAAATTAGNSKEAAISIESDGDQDSGSGESGNSGDDEKEQAPEDLQEHHADDSDDEEQEEKGLDIPDLPYEKSMFSRVEPADAPTRKETPTISQMSANKSSNGVSIFGTVGKGTPEAPPYSPITPATAPKATAATEPKGNFVPTTNFNWTPTPATATSSFGSNLKDGPVPGEGLFGSRSSTPQPGDASKEKDAKPTSSFGARQSFGSFGSGADNTWKAGSPIKFGSSTTEQKDTTAPAVEVTAATPPAKETPKPFAGLFGQSTSTSATNGGTSLGFNFGHSATSTTDKPAPGFLGAASHLKGGASSGLSSRDASPGLTSEAESVTTDTEETYNDPQASFMSANAGEENEDVLYESKAALSRMYKESDLTEDDKEKKGLQPGWKKIGVGSAKVLKDKSTGKARIVFRAEPGANVLLNTRLLGGAKYSSSTVGKNGAVNFPVAVEGAMQLWMVKVKTREDADKMAGVMEGNKGN
ncbi:hypothetical protein PMZ80_002916 [Knufia obscura]|uniref:RanBD1 domain-containing protein n=2 Tax=Knufia TaxID=430999 RepID=A0AAN8F6X7_9EURO|nr:hypothetical protein PMZ80_002916 [Knufia obscura]KAK5952496.1 hypothetical protein OHC33_006540 [Knufia fluminis]